MAGVFAYSPTISNRVVGAGGSPAIRLRRHRPHFTAPLHSPPNVCRSLTAPTYEWLSDPGKKRDDVAMSDASVSAEDSGFGEHAVTILATEHWGLLATRSLAYTESFSRVTVFLTVLSASIVALALVANTAGLDDEFTWAVGLLAPLVLFLGVTTYARLIQLNLDDILTVMAMNRLRNAYTSIAPEVIPYLTTGWHDDVRGVSKSLFLVRSSPPKPASQFFITTPTVIAIISGFVAGAAIGLLVQRLSESPGLAILSGAATMILGTVFLFRFQFKMVEEMRRLTPRFPSAPSDYSDELGETFEVGTPGS